MTPWIHGFATGIGSILLFQFVAFIVLSGGAAQPESNSDVERLLDSVPSEGEQ